MLKHFILCSLFCLLYSNTAIAATTDTKIKICGRPVQIAEGRLWEFTQYGTLTGRLISCKPINYKFSQLAASGVGFMCVDCWDIGDTTPSIPNIENQIEFIYGEIPTPGPNYPRYCDMYSYFSWSDYSCTPCGSYPYVAYIPPADADYATNYLQRVHNNTSCSHCNLGAYRSGSTCVQCPEYGSTDDYDSTSITDCYKTQGHDETGFYEYNPGCHYQP